jgi:hypothetical protein
MGSQALNAAFTVPVSGVQTGGTQTTTAVRHAGQTWIFDVEGSFVTGQHVVSVGFLNDACAGTRQTHRNLYVTGAVIDGASIPGSPVALMNKGPESFAFGVIPSCSGIRFAPEAVLPVPPPPPGCWRRGLGTPY